MRLGWQGDELDMFEIAQPPVHDECGSDDPLDYDEDRARDEERERQADRYEFERVNDPHDEPLPTVRGF